MSNIKCADNESNSSNSSTDNSDTDDYIDSNYNEQPSCNTDCCPKSEPSDGDSECEPSDNDSDCEKPKKPKCNDKIVQFGFNGTVKGWQPLLGYRYNSNIMGIVPLFKSRLYGFTLEKGFCGNFSNGKIYIVKYTKPDKPKDPLNGLSSFGCLGIVTIKDIAKNNNCSFNFSVLPGETNVKINGLSSGRVSFKVNDDCAVYKGDSIGIYASNDCNQTFYSLYDCIFNLYLVC